MPPAYRIHPGIGIARLGNSPSEFCVSPEKPAALPIDCDQNGNPRLTPDGKSERPVSAFKDLQGRIKRQAARFQIFAFDDSSPQGRPLQLGDRVEGGGNHGTLIDIHWRVYIANKKAVWYQFQQLRGEHGYEPSHPRRNSDITDPNLRQKLIIDPGPRIVNATDSRAASFNRSGDGLYAPVFPPPLTPNSIDTLGEIRTDDSGRLLVLGGFGNSGSFAQGFGAPNIQDYANNDRWFDDVSDGPVMARLVMFSEEVGRIRFIDVEYPAWVLVGYPHYVPPILDMITLDDVIYDLAIREFAWRRDIFTDPKLESSTSPDPAPLAGQPLLHWRSSNKRWNRGFKPWFYRDVWPILFRPDEFTYLCNVLGQSNAPHNKSQRGTFDPEILSAPPILNERALRESEKSILSQHRSGELFVLAADPLIWTAQTQWEDEIRAAAPDLLPGSTPVSELEGKIRRLLDRAETWLHGPVETRLKAAIARFTASLSLPRQKSFADFLKAWIQAAQTPVPAHDSAKHALDDAFAKARLATETHLRKILQSVFPGQRFAPLQTKLLDITRERLIRPWTQALEQTRKEFLNGALLRRARSKAERECVIDLHKPARAFLYSILRLPGEENRFQYSDKPDSRVHNLPLMPLLAGDNPISNVAARKFLRLTDYQLFILKQWAEGSFLNEKIEGWPFPDPLDPYANWQNPTPASLDRAVLMNGLGGAFCPGGEVCWIIRNPAIYHQPYRIKADPDFSAFHQTAASANANSREIIRPDSLYIAATGKELSQDANFEKGLQPGDLTKYGALPWQADFNECTTQQINLTFSEWNSLEPNSINDAALLNEQKIWETLWWPAHRPLQTAEVVAFSNGQPVYQTLDWARGIPQTNSGDLKMVADWAKLGFVILNPYLSPQDARTPSVEGAVKYISVERNPQIS